jgi:cystathionine gamma-lyase
MKFSTRAIHVGHQPDQHHGAVVPPIHLATTFVQPGAGTWGEYDYSRSGNPTRATLEKTLASLEGGCGALAFASGMAATHTVSLLCQAGEHVVATSDMYGGTYRLLHQICSRAGIEVSLVPAGSPEAIDAAIRSNTRLVWIESVGNPLMTLSDIAACADVAHRHGAWLAVDNTFATPAAIRPLELGADIVMHSATKYLAGHSDCMAGALAVADPQLHQKLYFIQNATGNMLGPWESFMLGRGLKTLQLRFREQSRSAMQLARALESHPRVTKVLYPGLESHPQHALAARLMDGFFGGVVSFEVTGGNELARECCQRTRLFGLAVSLGAVESLIEHPASMSHASYAAEDRQRWGIGDGLVRISVGLEDPQDLWADLEQALAAGSD